jgi:hypothetical protein
MRRWVRSAGLVALVSSIVVTVSPSQAAQHLWRLSQVFSNASGSVQFIQLGCPDAGENNLGTFGVTSSGHSFSFVTNLNGAMSTANAWVLIATAGFGSLPGAIAPDYTLPVTSFFSTGGDTLTYAGGVDTWTFGAVPTDGVNALMRNISTLAVSTAPNLLQNFANPGVTSSINLSTPTPALPSTAIAALVGAILLVGSGLLRKRNMPAV